MEPRIISFKPKANCTQFGCFDAAKGNVFLNFYFRNIKLIKCLNFKNCT